MPYQFKDNGSDIIKPFARRIYLIVGILMLIRTPIDYFLLGQLDYTDILNPPLAIFMLWGVNKNGFYKIARWNAERQLKKRDNKWRNSYR